MNRLTAENIAQSVIDMCEWPADSEGLIERLRRNMATALIAECAATQEKCAQVADKYVAQHDGRNYPGQLRTALQLEGRAIASAIRALKMETGHGN